MAFRELRRRFAAPGWTFREALEGSHQAQSAFRASGAQQQVGSSSTGAKKGGRFGTQCPGTPRLPLDHVSPSLPRMWFPAKTQFAKVFQPLRIPRTSSISQPWA